MSLLLDALKKAAKDKEQATAASSGDVDGVSDDEMPVDESESSTDASLELTLDDDSSEQSGIQADEAERSAEKTATQEHHSEEQELTIEQQEVHSASTTVSDEALQMLVYKTNSEHRRKQKTVWLSITLTSVLILLMGGYYFYSEMVKDVEALERKHNIALQKVNAEVIKRKNPRLIRDLTDKPMVDTRSVVSIPGIERTTRAESVAVTNSTDSTVTSNKTASRPVAKTITFKRKRQQDPVGELLNKGWVAYNENNYAVAKDTYQKVLDREPNNRDALLGTAAIASAQGDTGLAIRTYEHLLRLDPRDPVAVPALANLQQRSLDGLDESRLKQLLKRQPEAAQVNFALGNIKAEQQAWPQAQQYYFDAWHQEPDNADYAFNIAVSLDHLGKVAEARSFYERSLTLSSKGAHSVPVDAVKQRIEELSGK